MFRYKLRHVSCRVRNVAFFASLRFSHRDAELLWRRWLIAQEILKDNGGRE